MRDDTVVMSEMLDAIAAARECRRDRTFEAFSENIIARLAAERAIEIISEASRHLSMAVMDRHPQIPWRKIKAIGNILRHEYHRVAPRIVWEVIETELGPLQEALELEVASLR